jgi:hypothetical protein
MKRRIFTIALTLLMVLCVVLWVHSYFVLNSVGYGWSPRGKPDRMLVADVGCAQGQIGFYLMSAPTAFTNYIESAQKGSKFRYSGFNWWSYPVQSSIAPRNFGFAIVRTHRTLPVYADGTLALGPAATAPSGPVHQSPISNYSIVIPLWLPFILLVARPIWQLINLPGRKRRKRIIAGQCLNCGYDLRASPDRCPECGAISEKLSNLPTSRQIFWRFCMRTVAGCATSLLFALTLAGFSSVLISQFLYQNMLGLRPQFLQSWSVFNRYMACVALCALGIIFSAMVSLLLVDGLRRLRSIPPAKN